MNESNRVLYYLTNIYKYAVHMRDNCKYEDMDEDNNILYAANFCIIEIGDMISRISEIDKELYNNDYLELYSIKGLRNRLHMLMAILM